jgi:hypothetical protein
MWSRSSATRAPKLILQADSVAVGQRESVSEWDTPGCDSTSEHVRTESGSLFFREAGDL